MPALLLPNEILSMPAQAARRLIEAGEGDPALLYLALLDGGDTEKAGQALRWGDDRLAAAYRRLVELELAAAEGAPAAKEEAREQLPAYTRKDLADALEHEPEFSGLCLEVERLLGRRMADHDLEILLTIYDALALPHEVILLLVNFVVRTLRRQQNKPGAVPRMSQVRAEAARWKRLGLDTVELAEDYIRRQEQVDGREWAILSAVGIVGEPRPAVAKEREYIGHWVELGLSDELIALAYENTVFQKGKMSWPYANKILLQWYQSGWTTPEQVKANDRPPARKPSKAAAPAPGEDYQPTFQRIQKNDEWLDEFLKQQGSEV